MTEKKQTLKELRADIKRNRSTLQRMEGFSHNIIAITLQIIANEYGVAEANKAIRELKLDKLGWSEVPCDESSSSVPAK